MAKVDKNPSKRAVSAASVKGNAGPDTRARSGKTQSTNQQYGAHNTGGEG
ncbi:YuzL family protein [Fredinandcohnia onubensis]|nr:YuzL family protein [Fredinandcohnia onubensis]